VVGVRAGEQERSYTLGTEEVWCRAVIPNLWVATHKWVVEPLKVGRGALEGGSRVLNQKVQQTGDNILLLNISKKNAIFSA
jgi:hypothetical protein